MAALRGRALLLKTAAKAAAVALGAATLFAQEDRKSTRLNSSH